MVPEKFVPILDLSPLLTILMVIVGLLILITCCIVISMRSQDSKRRKKPYAYNSKDSLEKNPDIIPNKDGWYTFSITYLQVYMKM